MRKTIGVYIDVANLYYSAKTKYGEEYKLDYAAYMKFIKDLGTVLTARAYGSQVADEAAKFLERLAEIGIQPVYEKTKVVKSRDGKVKYKFCWSVGITVEMIRDMPGLDMLVLGSGNGDMIPLIKYLVENGKHVLILACSISRDVLALEGPKVTICEIPKSMFEVKSTQ
jgi:uncharacterized LabA/DUF88 family protein